eukprot:scaffold17038_cov65-Isochrysis_galbana.AAC.2
MEPKAEPILALGTKKAAHPFRVLECVAHRLVARLNLEAQPERHLGLRVPLQVSQRAAGAETGGGGVGARGVLQGGRGPVIKYKHHRARRSSNTRGGGGDSGNVGLGFVRPGGKAARGVGRASEYRCNPSYTRERSDHTSARWGASPSASPNNSSARPECIRSKASSAKALSDRALRSDTEGGAPAGPPLGGTGWPPPPDTEGGAWTDSAGSVPSPAAGSSAS